MKYFVTLSCAITLSLSATLMASPLSISLSGVLFSITDSGKGTIWLVTKIGDKTRISCPVKKEQSTTYKGIENGDTVRVSGIISSAGAWAKKDDVLSLYLEDGCSVTKL
ncbi:hypothetical protein [Thiocystis violascens]|uniref:hypothetical protein n=1 Tax=Thiocystis violascens TaxID=73141 RepID=UPI0012F64720|nr:hypothetical protein [Thiocystis violascens]